MIITDLVMPEMNGVELAARIHSIDEKIKILYMSGYTDNYLTENDLSDGNFNFLQKPFSSRDLIKKVREVFDKPID